MTVDPPSLIVSAAERSLGASTRQWCGLGLISVAAIVGDQVTKHLVTSRLGLYDSVTVVGPLHITHVQNSGIAFGFFPSATTLVTALTVIALGWMLWFFARSGARHPVLPTAFGLLIGGSLSNLFDRVWLGHVTDFLDLGWWPAFNLADSFIVLGVGTLVLTLALPHRPHAPDGVPLDLSAR
jgi:signal peptidase II